MASKTAAAPASATTEPPKDPLDLEIERCRQAIAETRESRDPAYVAKPWQREQLIEEIEDRIRGLEAQKVARARAELEAQVRQSRAAAWAELEPQRQELASRWNGLREQIKALLADARRLDALHLERCNRRGLSEAVMPLTLLRARAEVIDASQVLLRPVSDL